MSPPSRIPITKITSPAIMKPVSPAQKVSPAQNIAASAKTFTVKRNDPSEYGRKVVIYGPAGAGKSSLVSTLPEAVFINLNKGLNGLSVNVIDGVTTFAELRAAVQQAQTYVPAGGALVIDTISEVDEFIIDYLKTAHNKDSVAKLGYDKFPCATEALRLLISDLEAVIRSKRDVILLAHEATINYKNAVGDDYRQIGPKLLHSANDSCRDLIVAWSDHTVRVALADAQVQLQTNDKGKVVAGKAVNRSTERFITTDGNQSVIAKSRPVIVAGKFERLPSLISFVGPEDGSFWEGLRNPTIFSQEK